MRDERTIKLLCVQVARIIFRSKFVKCIVSLCFVLLSLSVFAEPKSWMKQAKPDSLGLFVSVSPKCPFTDKELVNRFEGEFLRARLKPTNILDFNLTVNIRCVSVKTKGGSFMGNVVSYEIMYASIMANGANILYERPNYGAMIVGDNKASSKQYFINTITDSVALSLTDYLKVNFQ